MIYFEICLADIIIPSISNRPVRIVYGIDNFIFDCNIFFDLKFNFLTTNRWLA